MENLKKDKNKVLKMMAHGIGKLLINKFREMLLKSV